MPKRNAFTNHLTTPIPQSEKAREDQVENSAGGYVFQVSDKARLERFLILGTDGGTYYVTEKDLTKQNVDWLVALIKKEPKLVLETTVAVSSSGRAYRNTPAIFTMSLIYHHADVQFKRDFSNQIPEYFRRVVRTSYHLFEFAQYVELLVGWGPSKRRAVSSWYTSKSLDNLAYQAVKYRQRDGWTHRDLFRISHPKGVDPNLVNFILGKEYDDDAVPPIIRGFRFVQNAKDINELLPILDNFSNMPWEALPTKYHKHAEVWQKLFYNGQLRGQALIRNIVRLAKLSAFDDMVFARDVAAKLTDKEMIIGTKLHPIQYLLALTNYTEGQITRNKDLSTDGGKLTFYGATPRVRNWNTSPIVVDALNAGFYESFKHVEPANSRTMIGLDISFSMLSPALGIDLSCAQVGAAMAMSIARTEPYYAIHGFADTFRELTITPNTQLGQVMNVVNRQTFGGTDCAVPMLYATKNDLDVDTFVVMTDNETWVGDVHPYAALKRYREKSGISAKLVVMAMTSTGFSIAEPTDGGMLDICGADSNVPKLVTDFSAGRMSTNL